MNKEFWQQAGCIFCEHLGVTGPEDVAVLFTTCKKGKDSSDTCNSFRFIILATYEEIVMREGAGEASKMYEDLLLETGYDQEVLEILNRKREQEECDSMRSLAEAEDDALAGG